MQYSSAVAQQAGISFDKLVAYIATVSSRTRLSAEMIGTAFKTMATRMQQVKAGEIDETGKIYARMYRNIQTVEKQLEEIYIG